MTVGPAFLILGEIMTTKKSILKKSDVLGLALTLALGACGTSASEAQKSILRFRG